MRKQQVLGQQRHETTDDASIEMHSTGLMTFISHVSIAVTKHGQENLEKEAFNWAYAPRGVRGP